MRLPFLTLILMLLCNVSADWYIYRFIKKHFSENKFLSRFQLITAGIFALGIISLFVIPVQSLPDSFLRTLMWIIFIYISVYVPKYIFVIFDVIASVPHLFKRRKIKAVTWTGAIVGLIVFCSFWWGALFNRFDIEVKDVNVRIDNLPEAFEGFRIAQISDLHVGTYGTDTAFVSKLVEQINALNPDVVLFTGDIVNRKTDELTPFEKTLSHIKAPYGVYSVLGNHDYGDYYLWPDSIAKKDNVKQMAIAQKRMGWNLLKNDYDVLTNKGDTLILIGVENIGDPPFHVYGDLTKAYPNLDDKFTKILLTHNPAHWVKDVADSDKTIALTLSGHTHAMQMSFFGFSPAVFRYKTWGGLYKDDSEKHQLYVNTGIGTVGLPARIGATPEITLITLHGK